jgi:hypothetical protein
VYLVPRDGQFGNVETLIYEAVNGAHNEAANCIAALEQCMNSSGPWNIGNRSKMRLHTAIAAYRHEDPSSSLAYVWNKAGNPIPLASPVFTPLVDFLRDLGQV